MRILVLALNGVFDTGLATILDTFQTANEVAELHAIRAPRFEVCVVGLRERVTTAMGLRVPVLAPNGTPWAKGRGAAPSGANPADPDLVVVPALGYKTPGPLERALADGEVAEAAEALRSWHGRGATVAAACVGTFVLAESGLLDGRRATTTWWLASLFAARYPLVALEEARMVVRSEGLVTAGAALGHVDLALSLIKERSPRLAALAARYLILDPRPSQAVFALADQLERSDPLVERFEAWARGRLAAGFSLEEAARSAGSSPRTLARRVRAVLGTTPLAYFQDLRAEQALHLLRTTRDSVDEIAARVGYDAGSTLRLLLKRRRGLGIRQIRGGA